MINRYFDTNIIHFCFSWRHSVSLKALLFRHTLLARRTKIWRQTFYFLKTSTTNSFNLFCSTLHDFRSISPKLFILKRAFCNSRKNFKFSFSKDKIKVLWKVKHFDGRFAKLEKLKPENLFLSCPNLFFLIQTRHKSRPGNHSEILPNCFLIRSPFFKSA